jgi:hypothetical protein
LKTRRLVVVAAVVLVGSIGYVWWMSQANQRLGEQVVRKIEAFKTAKGRLPEDLPEIGITVQSLSEPPVYYRKDSPDHYIVWYGLSLGKSMTYDSVTKKWEEHN